MRIIKPMGYKSLRPYAIGFVLALGGLAIFYWLTAPTEDSAEKRLARGGYNVL